VLIKRKVEEMCLNVGKLKVIVSKMQCSDARATNWKSSVAEVCPLSICVLNDGRSRGCRVQAMLMSSSRYWKQRPRRTQYIKVEILKVILKCTGSQYIMPV